MGLGKKSITLDPHRIKTFFSGYSTMVGTWILRKNSIGTRSPPKKIYIFVSDYSATRIHVTLEKINLTRPSLKKVYFRF